MKSTLADILPVGIAFDEADATLMPEPLWADEAALMAKAVPSRRHEFALGRTCARRALEKLGLAAASIPVLPTRAPAWPTGITGSITHCDGYTAAAVTRAADFRAIGIDAELNQPLPLDIRTMIASPEEFAALEALPDTGIHWDRLLFSAKESIFKTWSPLTGVWLDFLAADLRIDPAARSFRAKIMTRHPQGFSTIEGRFIANEDHLLTAICLPI